MTDNSNTEMRPLTAGSGKRRLRRLLLPIVIVVAAVSTAAGLIATKPKPPPVSVDERAWLISAELVSPDTYQPLVTLYGRVESLWSSSLTAGVTADVLEVPVVEGDFVEKGDLLGWFNMGSTVILLTPPGTCRWNDSLRAGTTVRMGEAMGSLHPA